MDNKRYVMAVGTDDAGVNLRDFIKDKLQNDPRVKEVRDFGVADASDKTAYPIICIKVAEAVARGEVDRAVLFGGTGLGEAISANKVRGARGARCRRLRSLLDRKIRIVQQLPGIVSRGTCDSPDASRPGGATVARVRVRRVLSIGT